MGLQVGRINHDGPGLGGLRSQPLEDPGEDAEFAPSLPAIVERLRRPILRRRIPPPQAVAIDEDNAAQDATVINARAPMALREEGAKALHLRLCQPKQVARHIGLLEEP